MVEGPLQEGIVARAVARGLLDIRVHDLRDFTTDRHRVVDDVPFGGGPGMVLKPEPLFAAVDAIGTERCVAGDPFARDGLLDYPQYTRPAEFRGMSVPPVLLSGHHGEIEKWRLEKALERTRKLRPDLIRGDDRAGSPPISSTIKRKGVAS